MFTANVPLLKHTSIFLVTEVKAQIIALQNSEIICEKALEIGILEPNQ